MRRRKIKPFTRRLENEDCRHSIPIHKTRVRIEHRNGTRESVTPAVAHHAIANRQARLVRRPKMTASKKK